MVTNHCICKHVYSSFAVSVTLHPWERHSCPNKKLHFIHIQEGNLATLEKTDTFQLYSKSIIPPHLQSDFSLILSLERLQFINIALLCTL